MMTTVTRWAWAATRMSTVTRMVAKREARVMTTSATENRVIMTL